MLNDASRTVLIGLVDPTQVALLTGCLHGGESEQNFMSADQFDASYQTEHKICISAPIKW